MLPIKLKIQGVNSYQKEQIIEFDKLLESKIFGIFGEVGSGKSTILEAISYVLYGKYDKLKGEKVSYNLMNLKSNRFVIDFEFIVENKNKYRFVAEGRRNSKNFNDVTVKRSYYIWNENEWLPKEKLEAKELIGLSFENFNRTIIIPQGRFMEFINLSGTDRTKMLKEIFNLYKYDLLDKVGHLQKINDTELANLEGKLSQLEDIDNEIIEENKKNLKGILEYRKKKDKEIQAKKDEFEIMERIRSDFLRLKELEEKCGRLLNQKPEIEKKEKIIKDYEFCVIEFKPDIERLDEMSLEISKLNSKKSKKSRKLEERKAEFDRICKKFDELSLEYEKSDNYKKQSEDYEKIVSIKKDRAAIDEKEELLSNKKKELSEIKKLNEQKQEKILKLKKQISKKNEEVPDITLLAEIKNWFLQVETIKRSLIEIINSLADKRIKLKNLNESISNIFNEEDIRVLKIDISLDLDELILQLENVIGQWKKGLKDLQKERDEIALKDKLKEFAHSLEDGKPCPVCGSIEHPQPLKVDDLQDELRKIKNRINKGETLIDKARDYLDKLKEIRTGISNEEKNIEDENTKYESKKKLLDDYLNSFKWDGFSPDDPEKVNSAFENAEILKKELGELGKELEEVEKEKFQWSKILEEKTRETAELDNQLAAMNSRQETLSAQLKEIKYDNFSDVALEKVVETKEQLDKKISEIISDFEKTGQEMKNLELELTEVKTEVKSIEHNLTGLHKNKSRINENLDDKMIKSGYKDQKQIKMILIQNIDIENAKEQIDNFKVNLRSTRKELDSLKAIQKDNVFNEERYIKVKKEIEKITKEIEELIEEKSRLENLIKEQESKLIEKERFIKERDEKKTRAEDLKVMRSLFTANGFVNFISTVRLNEVVNYANYRFMKLTRGKMKIELNKDNSFDVIDFLNNGERRSIKSLSGGQTFQASLSLALALASIVQQQNKSNQNFFFLDEGFGTQDEESLRLVFDTIKSLRKENRIVGLISHVSQLKEEVNTYLEVVHDEQEGSKVLKSWES